VDANATYLQNVTLVHVIHSAEEWDWDAPTHHATPMKWESPDVRVMSVRSVIRHLVKAQQNIVYATHIAHEF
jgi:hypothetical protein